MSKLRGTILTVILSFLAIMGIAQNSENYAAILLDSNEMLIGDRMTVHFKMELGDKDRVVSVTPVEPFDSVQSFEIVKKGEWKTSARQGRTVYFRDIVFTVWDTGLYKIPLVEFMVQYANGEQRFFQTNPLLLTVKNPKDWDKALELAPIKAALEKSDAPKAKSVPP